MWTEPFPRHLDDTAVCVGGPNDGEVCTSDGDCPGGVCVPIADDMFMGGAGSPVTTGPFRQGQWTPLHDTDLSRTNASPVNGITPAQIATVLGITYYDAANWDGVLQASSASFRNQLEGVHNTAHGWVGGQMGNPLKSPDDPVFWLHHAYVDCLWAEWERLHPDPPTAHYLPTNAPGNLNDDDAQMFPWPAATTPKSVKEIVPLGYIYVGAPHAIPAASTTGLIVLLGLIVLAGVIVIRRARRISAAPR